MVGAEAIPRKLQIYGRKPQMGALFQDRLAG
jgi:hypothetical protein